MFDKLYVLAKDGANVYSGHPKDVEKYMTKCRNKYQDRVPIEVLLEYCHNINLDSCNFLNLPVQSKTELSRIITDECLIEYDKFLSSRKKFSLVDFWNLFKRTMTHNHLAKWKNLVFQFIFYVIYGLVLRFGFKSEIVEPDGCLGKGFSDLNDICNLTGEYLAVDQLIKQNFKFIYLITFAVPVVMMVFFIIPFVGEIRVIENEYNNFKHA